MKRPPRFVLILLAGFLFGICAYQIATPFGSLEQSDRYEMVVPGGGEIALEDGAALVEYGAILKINDLPLQDQFRVELDIDYADKYGFFVGFETSDGNRFGYEVERGNEEFEHGQSFLLAFHTEGNRLYFTANGKVRSIWGAYPSDLKRVVLDSYKSGMRLREITVFDNDDVVYHDNFVRGGPLGLYRWLFALVVAFAILLLDTVEHWVLGRRKEIDPERRRISFGLSLTLLIMGVVFALIPGFHWLLPFALVAFVYLRIRFVLLALQTFSLPSYAYWYHVVAAVPVVLLAIVALLMSAKFDASDSSGAPWFAAVYAFALVIVIFGALRFLAGRTTLRACALVVSKSAVPAALLGVVALLGDSDTIRAIYTVALPPAVLILLLPLRANIERLRFPDVVLFLAAVLGLLSLEPALRSAPFAGALRPMGIGLSFQEDDLLFWAPRDMFPSGDDFRFRAPITVRKVKFRGDPVELEKEPGVFRIMVLGASNVWGDGLDDPNQAFSAVLEAELSQRFPNRKFEVINSGVRSYNTFQMKVFFQHYGVQYKPDLLILYAGRNDGVAPPGRYTFQELWDMVQKPGGKMVRKLQKNFSRSAVYNGLTRSVVEMRRHLVPEKTTWHLLKNTLPPSDFHRNIVEIVKMQEAAGGKAALAFEYWGEPFVADGKGKAPDYRNEMERAAGELNVPFYDAFTILSSNYPVFDIVFRNDVVHLNEFGHAELGARLADFVVSQNLLD